jgi:hypothetical protein
MLPVQKNSMAMSDLKNFKTGMEAFYSDNHKVSSSVVSVTIFVSSSDIAKLDAPLNTTGLVVGSVMKSRCDRL